MLKLITIKSLSIYFSSKNISENQINVTLNCDPAPCKTHERIPDQKLVVFTQKETSFRFNITAVRAGHDVIVARIRWPNDTDIE